MTRDVQVTPELWRIRLHFQRRKIINWSLRVGRLFGINIRLHLFFLIFVASEILRAMFEGSETELGARMYGLIAVVDMGILFLIVLVHELGHCFAARKCGGNADNILLWPLGGLAYVDAPNTPGAQFKTAFGGPKVNVMIFLALTVIILFKGYTFSLNPFSGWYPESWTEFWIVHTFKMNEILLLFNLLPAFPLDGGRMFQCILWPKIGFGQATLKAIKVGKVMAVLMGIAGFVTIGGQGMLLICVAIFIFFSCKQTEEMLKSGMLYDETFMGHDFSGGFSTMEHSLPNEKKPSIFQRMSTLIQERKTEKMENERARIDKKVDELLDKVSRGGLGSLTEKEKKFLNEASKKYRR